MPKLATPEAGAVEGSLLQKYQPRLNPRSRVFYPIWVAEAEGEQVRAVYMGSVQVDTGEKGGIFTAHNFQIKEWNTLTLIRSGNTITPLVDMIFSVSGKVMDGAVTKDDVGNEFVLAYYGLGKKKGKNNAAKLFQIHALQA